jgi:hypothetical protein
LAGVVAGFTAELADFGVAFAPALAAVLKVAPDPAFVPESPTAGF